MPCCTTSACANASRAGRMRVFVSGRQVHASFALTEHLRSNRVERCAPGIDRGEFAAWPEHASRLWKRDLSLHVMEAPTRVHRIHGHRAYRQFLGNAHYARQPVSDTDLLRQRSAEAGLAEHRGDRPRLARASEQELHRVGTLAAKLQHAPALNRVRWR